MRHFWPLMKNTITEDDKKQMIEFIKSTDKFTNGPKVVEFEKELDENTEYNLIIKRSGKGHSQTVVNDKGDILKDQMLHIKGIEIDEIDIGALVYDGVYTPSYPEPWASQQHEAGVELKKSFKNVTQMGHNGEWKFTFNSPFYIWLLENLY